MTETATPAAHVEQVAQPRIEIDQFAITAPDFPRDATWWRGWLPVWFVEPRWWEMPQSQVDWSRVTVEAATGVVSIRARDSRHAAAILKYLRNGPLGTRLMTAPETNIRLIETSPITRHGEVAVSTCGECGDEASVAAGEPCGRDLSEEEGLPNGTRICPGVYVNAVPGADHPREDVLDATTGK